MTEQLVARLLPLLAKTRQQEFNVFDVMRYGGYERQLSDIFAWLLDAGGTHKLGERFLRIFIDEVNRGLRDHEPVPLGAYGVRQEVNTAEAGDGGDIADVVVDGAETVLVIENFHTSSGHGHSYDGYLSFGSREGKRSVVVLLCETRDSGVQSDGWEQASVVTYASLVQRLMTDVSADANYRRDCAAQYSFVEQLHERFAKGRKMNNDALIEFFKVMCATGEAGRYGFSPIEPAAVQFADLVREQAKAQFDDSREMLQRLKTILRNYAAGILKTQINKELGHDYISAVTANLSGRYQWTINFSAHGEPDVVLQLKFGPSAWLANEENPGDYGERWQDTVPLNAADYAHVFITRMTGRMSLRQSAVTLAEVLDGLSPDDFRLRDEILQFLREGSAA